MHLHLGIYKNYQALKIKNTYRFSVPDIVKASFGFIYFSFDIGKKSWDVKILNEGGRSAY